MDNLNKVLRFHVPVSTKENDLSESAVKSVYLRNSFDNCNVKEPAHGVSQRLPRKSISRFTVSSNLQYGEHDPTRMFVEKPLPQLSHRFETKREMQKRRNQLLEKKVIHGSLESLDKIGNDCSGWSQFTTLQEACRSNIDKTNLKKRYSLDANIPSSGQMDSEEHTGNISRTNESSQSRGLDDNIEDLNQSYQSNISNSENCPTSDDDCANQNFENTSSENDSLKGELKEQKKKWILYKTLCVIVFKALKQRSLQLTETEKKLMERREECAARVILHHLLLNSWKTTKGQVMAISSENAHMHKTIDNQSLQLSIVRKMQSIEKEKAATILKEYNEVKGKYHQAVQENETIKEEYANVLGEKRCLVRQLEILKEENSRLNVDLQMRLDKKEMLLRSMEIDRIQAEKFCQENENLVKEAAHCREQIKDLTVQQAHWQEKAMKCESQCYELRLELERKMETFEKAINENANITRENKILNLSKSKLEQTVADAQKKLDESTQQKLKLEEEFKTCKDELEDLEDRVQYLQNTLRRYKKENVEIRQKLYNCTLRNVQKRRVWGAALYFLVSPIEAFKRLYFGSPVEERHMHNRNAGTSSEN